jgi:hypothetical protein
MPIAFADTKELPEMHFHVLVTEVGPGHSEMMRA